MKGINIIEELDSIDYNVLEDEGILYVSNSDVMYIHTKPSIWIESVEDNNVISFSSSSISSTKFKGLTYSYDNINWSPLLRTSTITLNSGDRVYLRGNGKQICKTANNTSTLFKTTLKFNIGGDLKGFLSPFHSLPSYAFCNLFKSTKVVDASQLIVDVSSASISKTDICLAMFSGCQELLNAPKLPAKAVPNLGYASMFLNCINLTSTPILYANVVNYNGYKSMFSGCTNLSKVICLEAYELSQNNDRVPYGSGMGSTSSWLNKVSASGTFIKRANVTTWTTGASGIPEGWTVEDYTG